MLITLIVLLKRELSVIMLRSALNYTVHYYLTQTKERGNNVSLQARQGRKPCVIPKDGKVIWCLYGKSVKDFVPPCQVRCAFKYFYQDKGLRYFVYTQWKGWLIEDKEKFLEDHPMVMFAFSEPVSET